MLQLSETRAFHDVFDCDSKENLSICLALENMKSESLDDAPICDIGQGIIVAFTDEQQEMMRQIRKANNHLINVLSDSLINHQDRSPLIRASLNPDVKKAS